MLLYYCGLKQNKLYSFKLKIYLLSNKILEPWLETEASANQKHDMWQF
jgi:hypothetical protein